MQFVFVTSFSTSETQGKLTQYQHHRKNNNQKFLHPVDQPLADFRPGKTTWKGNSTKSRSQKYIIRKTDENTIIACHRSTDKHKQLLLRQGNTQRRLSVKSLTTEIISSLSHSRSLHLVLLHKPELFFVFSGLLG